MKVATKSSSIGFLTLAVMFTSLHFFAIQKQAGNPLLSIPLASVFIFALAAASVCIFLNLRSGKSISKIVSSARIFLTGYGISIALVVISMFSVPDEIRAIPSDALISPVSSLFSKFVDILIFLASAHWWVHIVLGLSLLIALITTIGLFITTDMLGALNATIAGPFAGLLIVAVLLLAAYVIAIAALGAFALAGLYLKLISEQN